MSACSPKTQMRAYYRGEPYQAAHTRHVHHDETCPPGRAGGTSPRSELEGPLPTEARLGGAASGDVARSRWAVAFRSGRVAVTVTGRCSVVKGHFDIPSRSGRPRAFFVKGLLSVPPLGRPLALTATPACSHPAMPVPVCSWPARAASSRCSWRTPTPHSAY